MASVHRDERRPDGSAGGRSGAPRGGSGRLPGVGLPVRGRGQSDADVRSRRTAPTLAERSHPPTRRPREERSRRPPGVRKRPACDDGRADRRGWATLERAAPHHVESVRRRIFDHLDAGQVAALESIFTAISEALHADPACAGHLTPLAAARMTELPSGFRSHVANIGVKDDTDDLVVIAADRPVPVAALFTKSRFAGPSVTLSRRHVANGFGPGGRRDLEERQRRDRPGRRRRCARGRPARRRSASAARPTTWSSPRPA